MYVTCLEILESLTNGHFKVREDMGLGKVGIFSILKIQDSMNFWAEQILFNPGVLVMLKPYGRSHIDFLRLKLMKNSNFSFFREFHIL